MTPEEIAKQYTKEDAKCEICGNEEGMTVCTDCLRIESESFI